MQKPHFKKDTHIVYAPHGKAVRRLSLSKILFDKLSNANRGVGFAFEQAARSFGWVLPVFTSKG